MRQSSQVLAVGAAAGIVGLLSAVAPVLVAVATPVLVLAPFVAFRFSPRTLGLVLFTATLVTRLRVPPLGLLPEQVALALVLGILLMRGRADFVIRALRVLPVSVWLFVFWGGAISVLHSPDPAASLRIVGWIAASALLASVVVTLCNPTRPHDLGVYTGLVALSASIGVAAWLVASLVPTRSFGVQTEALTGAPAAFGLAYEANIFGGICAIWLVIDVLYVKRSHIAVGVLVRIALALGVIVSLTRAAAIGVLIGVAIGAVANRRTRRVGASMLLVGLIVVSGLFIVGPAVPALRPIADKGAQLVDLDSSTSVVRRQTWDLALSDLDVGTLVTGGGVNTFGQRHEDPTRPSEDVPGYLGNLFLQLIYDVGLIGTTLLALAAVTVLKGMGRVDARAVGVIACAAVVSAATSPLWFANWWVVAAIAATRHSRRKAQSASVPGVFTTQTCVRGLTHPSRVASRQPR